jgi:hypothetical protein
MFYSETRQAACQAALSGATVGTTPARLCL